MNPLMYIIYATLYVTFTYKIRNIQYRYTYNNKYIEALYDIEEFAKTVCRNNRLHKSNYNIIKTCNNVLMIFDILFPIPIIIFIYFLNDYEMICFLIWCNILIIYTIYKYYEPVQETINKQIHDWIIYILEFKNMKSENIELGIASEIDDYLVKYMEKYNFVFH